MAYGEMSQEDGRKKLKEYGEQEQISERVMRYLCVISDNYLGAKSERDAKNELIRKLFKEGFEIHDPSGTMKIGSKALQQALWRVMSKVKFLNVALHGTGRSEDVERMVSEGVRTVADRGDLTSCFRDKGGVFMNAFMYGDGFLMFGKGSQDENPVRFQVEVGENVYADNFAYGVRGVRPANRMAVIHQYDKEEAYEQWPELEECGVFGRIPGSFHSSDRIRDREDNNVLEVAWGWNLPKKEHVIFAGTQGYEIDCFEGKEYPYMLNGDPFIPVFQFICQPSEDGFFNYGIAEMIFDLAVITRKLMNLEVGHLEENVYPITLINAPQSKVDELVEKMAMANEARRNNTKPFVAMEFDPSGGQQSVATQTLLTQNLFNEWSAVWDRLYKEFSRLGINLDDIERGAGITRGQVVAEEQASNAFVLQMMEYNASESKKLIECTVSGIKEFVSVNNKTPLNLMSRVNLPDGTTARLDRDITMGMLSKELKEGNWFAIVDSRTGAVPSDLLKMVQWEHQLSVTPPGTPEWKELYRQIASSRGIDLPSMNGTGVPQATSQPQPGQAGGQPSGAEPQPTVAQTQRVVPAMAGSETLPV